MFGTLIESHPTGQRRRGSAAVSAIAHLAVIAGALGSTTQHPVAPPVVPTHRSEPLVFVSPAGPVIDARGDISHGPVCDCVLPPLPIVRVPGPVTVDAPSLDLRATTGSDFDSPQGSVVSNPFAGAGRTVGEPGAVYITAQVEREVAVVDAARPAYPGMLRAAGVEGRVVVRFVVDTTGHVEPSSIEVREASHALFDRAVRDVLPRFRFTPAEVAGRHVRQLVEMPFQFSLSNR